MRRGSVKLSDNATSAVPVLVLEDRVRAAEPVYPKFLGRRINAKLWQNLPSQNCADGIFTAECAEIFASHAKNVTDR